MAPAWDGRAPSPGWWWIDTGPAVSREAVRPFHFDGEVWEVRDGRVLVTPSEAASGGWKLLGMCHKPAGVP